MFCDSAMEEHIKKMIEINCFIPCSDDQSVNLLQIKRVKNRVIMHVSRRDRSLVIKYHHRIKTLDPLRKKLFPEAPSV